MSYQPVLETALKGQSTAYSMITLSFWWGYWVGLGRFMRLGNQNCGQMLGCAKPTTFSLATVSQEEELVP